MKRTKINLLINKRDYGKVTAYFKYLRISVLTYTILLLLFVVTFLWLHYSQTKKLQSLIDNQENLGQIAKQKEQEVKLIYAGNKVKALEKFLLEDANFYPYYELLIATLNQSAAAAQLSSLTIDKARSFEFSLTFSTFEQMISSFRLIESQNFLRNFETLSLVDFRSGKTDENYQLSFEGKFKKVQ